MLHSQHCTGRKLIEKLCVKTNLYDRIRNAKKNKKRAEIVVDCMK